MVDIDYLTSIAYGSEVYTDIPYLQETIPFFALGTNGVYIVLEAENTKLIECLQNELELKPDQFFAFVFKGESGSFYDYQRGYIPFRDILDAFTNCYDNHLIPDADVIHVQFSDSADYCNVKEYESVLADDEYEGAYITPVIPFQQLEYIVNHIKEMMDKPITKGNYLIYPDGHMTVKKEVTKNYGPIQTFLVTNACYYPCVDESGDTTFLRTLLGGWFGLHKFKAGNYLTGIGYLLTFGWCGVAYVLDLVSILIGGYKFHRVEELEDGTLGKKLYFNRPVKKKLFAVLGILAAIVFSFLMVRYIYLNGITHLTEWVATMVAENGDRERLLDIFGISVR